MKEDWKLEKLEAVITQFIVPQRDRPKVFDGDIPWCRIEDIDGIFLSKSKSGLCVSQELIKSMPLRVYPKGTVIVSCSADLGRCAIIANPLITNQTFIGLVPSKDIDSLYLYYLMGSKASELNKMASGATIKYLSKKKFQELQIPIPTLAEQKQIVKLLDQAFKAIDQAKSNIEKNIANAKELLDSYKLDLLSKCPDSEFVEFDSVVKLTRGHNPPKKDFISEPKEGYVRFYQIRDGWSDKYKVYVPETPKLHRVEEQEILMVAYRHIGRAFRGVNGAFNVALCKITNLDESVLNNDYLFELIPSPFIRDELLKVSERSLIPSMSVKELAKLKVPLPSIKEQEKMVKLFDEINSSSQNLIENFERKLQNLEELKKSILQKAFSGELTNPN